MISSLLFSCDKKPMVMEELTEFFKLGFRFNPSPMEAVTYYLPRLISGEPLHHAARIIHHADVYASEPKDLAGKFAPVPKSECGDRFFFTLCRRQKGSSTRSARTAGPGTWVSQKTKEITNGASVKIGETKSFRFKKDGVNTDWLMEEYRCCLEEAVVGDAEQVLCKMYVSPRAAPGSAARQESAAFLRQEPAPAVPTHATPAEPATTRAPKRPAPVAEPPGPKRMRCAVPTRPVVQSACLMAFAPPRRWCEPQRRAPLPRRIMAPGPAPPASCLPRPEQEFVAGPTPACLPVASHRPLTEAPAASGDDDDFANFLECIIEAGDEMPIEEGFTSQHCPAAGADDDMDQFASSLEDMLDGREEGSLPTGQQQNPAAEADDDMDQFVSSLEDMLDGTEEGSLRTGKQQNPAAEADDDMDQFASSLEDMLDGTEEGSLPSGQQQNPAAEADDDMDQFASSLEEDLTLAQTEEAADEETAGGAEGSAAAPEAEEQVPSDDTLRDFLATYGETEGDAAAANELQKAFDVLNGFDDCQMDDAFLTVPLKDYNDQLFY